MGAIISDCGLYRYALIRYLDQPGDLNRVTFVMLNPSTADANLDDPTTRRCKKFSTSWGYNKLTIVNLYSYRTTSPKDLWLTDDPIGINNSNYLEYNLKNTELIVCAWGNNARQEEVLKFKEMASRLGLDLYCLGITKTGQPKHPLYIRSDKKLERYF